MNRVIVKINMISLLICFIPLLKEQTNSFGMGLLI